MKLNLPYEGTVYVFDTDVLSLAEAFTVKAVSGLRAGAFLAAVFDLDPGAWLAMLVLAKRRAGEAVLAEEIDQDKVDLVAVAEAVVDALATDVADSAEKLGESEAAEAPKAV